VILPPTPGYSQTPFPGLALGGAGAARYGPAMVTDPYTVPSLDDIDAMARRALAEIPEELRRHARDVVIRVEEFPDPETERSLGLESPFDILGLYHGIPMHRKSVSHSDTHIDMIFLYRRPLLEYWREKSGRLDKIIRHVLIHEIGHHFGYSDEDMELLEK
jgi:predicted Zn-dependent protease with MMP-like domain